MCYDAVLAAVDIWDPAYASIVLRISGVYIDFCIVRQRI